MWLRWDQAAMAATGLLALALVVRPVRHTWATLGGAFAREAALVLALYALWQKAGDLAITKVRGAFDNARWVWDTERAWHLPSEVSLQRAFLPHPTMIEALNGYYAIVHVPALIVFLIWLFVRHRDRYPRWRNVGALLTGSCLLLQMVPVAPPRMFPNLGFVDAALRYGQSVYGPGGIEVAPQLAAMPSVHVAWAVFIAIAVVCTSTSRWRWLVVAHPVLTVLAVVATANHWWLDGIVACAVLAGALAVEWALRTAAGRLQGAVAGPIPARQASERPLTPALAASRPTPEGP